MRSKLIIATFAMTISSILGFLMYVEFELWMKP